MRAVVTVGFHHPVSNEMLKPGYVFDNDDAALAPVLADPELAHRVAVSDRNPAPAASSAPAPVSPPPAASAAVKE